MKKTLVFIGLLVLSRIGFAQVSQPISNLEVQVLDNDRVSLTWNLPNGCDTVPMVLTWITSETNDGGSTQAGFDDIFGHLYNSSDLRSLVGWSVDTISFYKTTLWTYRVCVWKRPNGESMQLIYSQLAQINDSIMAAWCDIPLDTTILVEEHTDYWFGVRATREEGQTGPIFPIPFDRGPAVTGKGDLFMPDLAHWAPMQIGYNAMIKATLSNNSQKGQQSNPTNGLVHIEGAEVSEIQVYNTMGQLVKTVQNTNEIDLSGLMPGVYSLRIKDLHQMVTNKKVVVKQD